MSWATHKFSKHSEPELLEFLKVVANQNPEPVSPELKKLWETLLPIDKEVLERIASLKPSASVECIDITDSDGEDLLQKTEETREESFKVDSTGVADFVDGVKEMLEVEDVLSDDVIKKMATCSPKELDEMFVLLSNDLSSDFTWKLWKSISNSNCMERNFLAPYFSKYILIQKIISNDHIVKDLLHEMFEAVSDSVSTCLASALINTNVKDLSVIRKHIQVLPDSYRNVLLRQFLKACSKLQSDHVASISCLISKRSDEDNLNIVIELMHDTAKEFSGDKIFGKLIIEVIFALGHRIISYESQVKHIIEGHKSIYESQARKTFENCLQNHRLNSSLSYV